jgi:uncharacterized damage-inducible protein DinB
VLADVTAAEAAARPLPGAHTIWEIVLHMTGWMREVARRVRGGEPALPAQGDWPPAPAPDEEAWRQAREDLAAAHRELLAALEGFPERRLDEPVGGAERDLPLGTGVPFHVMLFGLAQHDAYHTGQIALLKRGLRPG